MDRVEPDPDLYAVYWEASHWDNAKFRSGGDLRYTATSKNGLDWTGGGAGSKGRVKGFASNELINVMVASGGRVETWALEGDGGLYGRSEVFSHEVNAVACNGTVFVLVGDDGSVVTTQDVIAYTEHDTGVTANFTDVIWDGAMFLATADDGVVRASADGKAWTPAFPPTERGLRALAKGGEVVVVVDDEGVLLTREGSAWSGTKTNTLIEDVVWTEEAFVAVGAGGAILTSSNGMQWRSAASGTTRDLHAVAAGPVIVAVGDGGETLVSSNAASWRERQPARLLYFSDATFAQGRFVIAANSGGVFASTNGTDWTRPGDESESVRVSSIAGSDKGFVAAGDHADVVGPQHATVWYSADLRHWEIVHEESTVLWPSDVTWTGGRFFVGGDDGLLLTSRDGKVWEEVDDGIVGSYYGGITAYPQGFVAVVGSQAVLFDQQLNPVGSSQSFLSTPRGIVWTGSKFYANDWSHIYESSDGVNWNSVVDGTGLSSITWTGEELVVCGRDQIWVSTDGTDWAQQNPDTALQLYAVAASPYRLVAVGESGTIRTRWR